MAETKQSPELSVNPSSCLFDEEIDVEVKHLPANCIVTLHGLIRSDDGVEFEAFGHYISDSSGIIKGTVHHF